MSIGVPDSVKNISYLGTETSQPTYFYSTTASGVTTNDPLGVNSQNVFGQSGTATDNHITYANTGVTLISGTKLNLTLQRTVNVFISITANCGNLGINTTDNTRVVIFDYYNNAFIQLTSVLNPGIYSGGSNIAVTATSSQIFQFSPGFHILAAYMNDTGSNALSYVLNGTSVSYIVLGS